MAFTDDQLDKFMDELRELAEADTPEPPPFVEQQREKPADEMFVAAPVPQPPPMGGQQTAADPSREMTVTPSEDFSGTLMDEIRMVRIMLEQLPDRIAEALNSGAE